MPLTAQQILIAFDALPDVDQDAIVKELLSRSTFGNGEVTDEALVELTDELFQMYDAEETSNGITSH